MPGSSSTAGNAEIARNPLASGPAALAPRLLVISPRAAKVCTSPGDPKTAAAILTKDSRRLDRPFNALDNDPLTSWQPRILTIRL
jgi:hypothetical protein